MSCCWRLQPVDDRKPYVPGSQRRFAGTGSVRVSAVEHLALGDVTHDYARRLGHKGTAAFKRAWLADHDRDWLATQLRGEGEQMARFAERWAHRQAVLVGYVHVERGVYLAPSGSGADYTASPSRSIDPDAECVPSGQVDALRAVATRRNFKAALEAGRAEQQAQRGRGLRRAA